LEAKKKSGQLISPNTDATLFDYPETTVQRFLVDGFQHPPEHVENVVLILPTEAQHDQARMFIRRISSYVREIQVKCYEDSAFRL
jgi:hypothetical protein